MRRLRLLALVPLLAAVAITGACDHSSNSLAPEAPSQWSGSLFGGSASQSYTLLNQPLLGVLGDLKLSQLIGVDGGQISLLGATLIVPPGAVDSPTLFTLAVLPTGHVEVDLSATVQTLLGGLLGGSQQETFARPVSLTLSYARATNVTDPAKLTVVYAPGLLGYSDLEPIPSTVDVEHKTVTAQLPHFSRYLLASPN
ncbi:MAG TPA: hypothetical protein VFL93_04910 [Longimicrobiaceae bacterium]|nr:hypothetical protein [Longimicrobiaceae bacterium]